MTIPRCQLVDPRLTRWYHCISRCVRSARLLGTDGSNRKAWIERRLEHLAKHFAISVGGFAVMDNHLHVLCRLDPLQAQSWLADEVLTRWWGLFPPKGLDLGDPEAVAQYKAVNQISDEDVERYRSRLGDLGWFMKLLKEPLSRFANQEDGVRGAFWEGRYKSIAILDEEALLATCVYIDLNPFAAGIAATPEVSKHTSVSCRVRYVSTHKQLDALGPAAINGALASFVGRDIERGQWLAPIQKSATSGPKGDKAVVEGMMDSFSLGSYLLILDYTARMLRKGKARLAPHVAPIFNRLGIDVLVWTGRLRSMLKSERFRGNCLASRGKGQRSLRRWKSASPT